jgi:ribosomal protein L40E
VTYVCKECGTTIVEKRAKACLECESTDLREIRPPKSSEPPEGTRVVGDPELARTPKDA